MSLGRRPSTSTISHESHYSRQFTGTSASTGMHMHGVCAQPVSSHSAPVSPAAERKRAHTFSEASSPSQTRLHHSRPSPLKSIHCSPSGSPLSSPQHFDLKRLLSKPAPPYARAHGPGSGSESDGTVLSDRGGEEQVNYRARNRTDPGPSPGMSKSPPSFDIDVNISSGVPLDLDFQAFEPSSSIKSIPSSSPVPSRSDAHSPMTPSPPNAESPNPTQKRTRNVLKRRPSNPTSNKSPGATKSPQSPLSSWKTWSRSPVSDPLMSHTTAMTSNTSLPSSAPSTPTRGLAHTPDAHRIPRTTNTEVQGMSHSDGARKAQAREGKQRAGEGRQRYADESPYRGRSQSRTRNSPSLGPRDSRLTPAGEVVEAYKRQEEARLSGGSGGSGSGRGSVASVQRKRDWVAGREAEVEGSPAPYYTVLGSSSERVRAVDADRSWEGHRWESTVLARGPQSVGRDAEGSGSESKPGLAQTLTRKVSGRWKRGGTAGGETSEDVGKRVQVDSERGRMSLQERKTGRFIGQENPKKRRSVEISIDQLGGKGSSASHKPPTQQQQSLIPLGWTIVAEPEVDMNLTFTPPPKSKKPESGGSGGRIWKLVKRLSSSGLRDKYYRDTTSDDPPPVPVLPKDHQPGAIPGLESTTPTDPIHHPDQRKEPSSSSAGGISRFIYRSSSGGTSPSGRKSSGPLVGLGKSLSLPHSVSSTPTSSGTTSMPSPPASNNSHSSSTPNVIRGTTPSSSPNSSDVASSRLFSRPSARSSTSSLFSDGNAPPMPVPPPNMLVGQHIIPPSELLFQIHSEENVKKSMPVLDTGRATSRSTKLKLNISSGPRTSEDWMIRHTPAAELAPLPAPPRRSTPRPIVRRNSYDSDLQGSASPTIPAFSTVNTINTFGPSPRRASSDTRKSLPSHVSSKGSPVDHSVFPVSPLILAPPRSTKNSHQFDPRPSTSRSTSTSPSFFSLRKRREPLDFPAPASEDVELSGRRSTSGLSNASGLTMRPSLHQRPSSVISEMLSPARYKEAGPIEQKALTEQEKADKWDDLLERSARAGGTLHLGAAGGEDGLRSDTLRFSGYSEIS